MVWAKFNIRVEALKQRKKIFFPQIIAFSKKYCVPIIIV